MTTKPAKYHPLLVAIHWTSAILILFMLSFGTLVLARMPNGSSKLLPLTLHMITGLLILVLTITRFVVRLVTPKPEPATIGNKFLDSVGVVTHWLLYIGAFGMGLSGLIMAVQSGLFQMIATGNWNLAGGFYDFTPRLYHHYFAMAMDFIILLHIAAALFHQVIRKDNLIARMSFGRRSKA
jgi:cytochrome b561